MDPNTVKLNTFQKIKPLMIAINREIPWQIALFLSIATYVAISVTATIPVFIPIPAIDFFVRRILCGGAIGGVTWFICAGIYMFLDDKVFPLIGKIRRNYEEEAFEVKKKVLDNVIDDEILKK